MTRTEALDEVLRVALTAIDHLDHLGEELGPSPKPVLPLIDRFKASIAAEAVSLMEQWPS